MKKRKLTKIIGISIAAIMMFGLAGCGENSTEAGTAEDKDITVISREEGSGTRDAFTELTGILENDVDRTVDTAEISNSTSVVIQSVAGNDAAIGYISMGAMTDDVKALAVDGAEPAAENVKSGVYSLQRSFDLVTKEDIGGLPQDFIDFIMSKEGQKIIEEEGYIAAEENPSSYESGGLSGTIRVAGSTSVAPVMEVLADKYKEHNSDVTIEIQQTGSGAGIQSTIDGVCDIGMASRELDDTEKAEGLESQAIALDGIAVIVNQNNQIKEITAENLMKIFTGEITKWADVK